MIRKEECEKGKIVWLTHYGGGELLTVKAEPVKLVGEPLRMGPGDEDYKILVHHINGEEYDLYMYELSRLHPTFADALNHLARYNK